MTLFMRDQENIERGLEQGIAESIKKTIAILRELGVDRSLILEKVKEKFEFTDEELQKHLQDIKW